MPILRGSVSFSRFRVEHPGKPPTDTRRWFERALSAHAFEPLDKKGDEERAVGFAELENPKSVEFPPSALFYGERALFCFRVDVLRIPAAQLRAELERWAEGFEREQGRKPARREKAEAKAGFRQQLRNRALPVTKTHDIAWNLKTGQLQIWSTTRKVVEEAVALMESAFGVKLPAQMPDGMARAEGIADEALLPTAELVPGAEVLHVRA